MASQQAPEFERILAALARALDQRELPYLVIGGQAVLVHGEPRLTRDIDVTLGVDPDRTEDALGVCAELGLAPLPEGDVAAFVRRTFVLPAVHEPSGVRVDMIFSTTPYERQAITRAVRLDVGGAMVAFASVEDLLLHKLFAGRPRDLEDARGVVLRNRSRVDWPYVDRWAEEFAAVPGKENLPELARELREEEP